MKISIVTLFPHMIQGFFDESIVKKAQERQLVEIKLVNLREFAIDNYGTVDDRPYGGGAGMILRIDVIWKALKKISNIKYEISKRQSKNQKEKIIITSPKGKQFNQKKAIEYSKLDHLVIIAGHYEAVDERVLDFIDEEISLGDFILTGGEIVASAVTDAVIRLIPGVLKKEDAVQTESFFSVPVNRLIKIMGEIKELVALKQKGIQAVKLLEYPHYTRPEEFMGKKVPEVLLSGNHANIEKWRIQKAYEETLKKRKDLLYPPSKKII